MLRIISKDVDLKRQEAIYWYDVLKDSFGASV
jgi:hypothetical protein